MAVNNRTEAQGQVTALIVPEVDNAIHRGLLNDNILNSVVFRKDIIASETEAGGAVAIDYVDKDTATVSTAVNLAVSFSNIENGDVKYLEVTKLAANTISFTGATDVSQRKLYINITPTVVQYVIRNKNNVITVESINIDNSKVDNEAWQSPSYNTGYTAAGTNPLRYRLLSDGRLELNGGFTQTGSPGVAVFTLPSGYRPSIEQMISTTDRSANYGITQDDITITVAGVVNLNELPGAYSYEPNLNTVIPLD